VHDREAREPRPRLLDEVVLDPVLLVFRVRDEDDLVGGEDAKAVCDRLQRLGIADRAQSLHAFAAEAQERLAQPPLGGPPGRIDVGDPEAETRAEGGRDDEHLGRAGAGVVRLEDVTELMPVH
jgi:hypothetical protein